MTVIRVTASATRRGGRQNRTSLLFGRAEEGTPDTTDTKTTKTVSASLMESSINQIVID